MRSTGEVMGIDTDFGRAFAKAQMAAGQTLPKAGKVFISVCDADKRDAVQLARQLVRLGFSIVCTEGTHKTFCPPGRPLAAGAEDQRGPAHMLDLVKNGEITLVINTPPARAITPTKPGFAPRWFRTTFPVLPRLPARRPP